MKVEIFTLCDAATTDAGGKLNILGSFDRLAAKEAPVTHPQCALAIKLRFERLEEGQRRIRISFVDSDGTSIMPTLDTNARVQFPSGESTITSATSLCSVATRRTSPSCPKSPPRTATRPRAKVGQALPRAPTGRARSEALSTVRGRPWLAH